MKSDFSIKRNDLSPAIKSQLLDEDDNPVDLSSASVRFIMSDYEENVIIVDGVAVIDNALDGIVYYQWQAGDTEQAGHFRAEWEVTYPNDNPETFPNDNFLDIKIAEDLG